MKWELAGAKVVCQIGVAACADSGFTSYSFISVLSRFVGVKTQEKRSVVASQCFIVSSSRALKEPVDDDVSGGGGSSI